MGAARSSSAARQQEQQEGSTDWPLPAFPCSSETRSRRVDVSTTRLLTYSTSTTRRRRTSHGAGRRSRNTATQAVIRQHVHLDEPRGRARRHGAHGVDGVSRGGSLAMASGAEGRLPRPLAPKFGTGSGLVRRLLGRFRPGAQSRSQNRTRAPVGWFDGQAPAASSRPSPSTRSTRLFYPGEDQDPRS